MKLLLDTHAFLWHADGSPQMSATATALAVDPANELFLSMASVWEIAIKVGMKKLTVSAPYVTFMTRAIAGYGVSVLPVMFDDCIAYERLPFPRQTAIPQGILKVLGTLRVPFLFYGQGDIGP